MTVEREDIKKNTEVRNAARMLSTKIRTILGYTYDALERIAPREERDLNPDLDLDAAELEKAYHMLCRLANNLTELADPGMGNTPKNENVVEVLTFAADQCRYAAKLRHIDLSYSSSIKECEIAIEKDRVERMLLNLLSNAIKYTPEGGRIRVEMEADDSFFKVRVSDTGCGMSEEKLATAFDRFGIDDMNGPNRVWDPKAGLGLGLYVARQIAREHGGDLTIQSEPGVGTVATATLANKKTVLVDLRETYYQYDCGLDHMLLELADVIPDEGYTEEKLC